MERHFGGTWSTSSPVPSIGDDEFSAQWTTCLVVDRDASEVRFSLTSDDGSRLFVDGTLLLNAWSPHFTQTFKAGTTLSRGKHALRVDYFELRGEAGLLLDMAIGDGPLEPVPPRILEAPNADGSCPP
jgi:hypothetical protein